VIFRRRRRVLVAFAANFVRGLRDADVAAITRYRPGGDRGLVSDGRSTYLQAYFKSPGDFFAILCATTLIILFLMTGSMRACTGASA
jgi:hypothetical protein